MIPYEKSFLGINLLFRVHGSPIWKGSFAGLISAAVFIIMELYFSVNDEEKVLLHPYGIGVLISSVSFLIVFRANYGYQRYWNACGDVHQMMSKWLDAVCHTGVYHMQQSHHNHIKPPSYYNHHDLNMYGLKRDREREHDIQSIHGKYKSQRTVSKSIQQVNSSESDMEFNNDLTAKLVTDSAYLVGEGRRDGGWGAMFDDNKSTFYKVDDPSTWAQGEDRGFASDAGGRTPNLFLQELVHLASLCCAVAFSTLRNDIDGAESPLDMYYPGQPWPEVDPDRMKNITICQRITETGKYILGFDKTPATRTKYNAMRPLLVLGGVSDNEIAFLQRARGPSAKVTLAWHWLSEFIIREHLAGSLGAVGPPIISRIIQFLSDGMIYYNHSRKTMYIPFPFPHAQISAFFVFTMIFSVPLLMDEYSNNIYLGAVLTFLTVTCLAGLHEVARELENPFRNVPNEIPLCTLQAMFNESLITLFSGFHPDHFWEGDDYRKKGGAGNHRFTTSSSIPSKDVPQAPETKSESQGFSALEARLKMQQKEINRLSAILEKSSTASVKSKCFP
mmetsp:Transcript_17813/g.20302  ORF Transcript_17813/g.20302 Transcript_17813/m.20302 type:complete len:560 (+) Transcript_17813:218-1897(+)